MAIEKIFPLNPDVIFYTTANFMQMWGELLRKDDKLLKILNRVDSWISKKKNHQDNFSDIVTL
jgi:hypothetical protein